MPWDQAAWSVLAGSHLDVAQRLAIRQLYEGNRSVAILVERKSRGEVGARFVHDLCSAKQLTLSALIDAENTFNRL
ncbi:hypothetical protein D7I39_21250 [Allopusillimonas ginsengisoli]|nr:hypothetical protein D7I39_21250 [Allopusillimonas ginsengisoli]